MKRALLIGYGSIGAKRARILRSMGYLLTIWEPNKTSRLRAVSDGFVNVLQSGFPDMLDVCDSYTSATGAFICSPPKLHAQHAIACLDAGYHVFIEKPIAHTISDARQISESAISNDREVMVGCNYRYGAVFRWDTDTPIELPRFTQNVRSLDILLKYHLPTARPGWRDSYANDPAQGGVILDSGAHAFDLAQVICGPIAKISKVEIPEKTFLDAQVEESVLITLKHTNNIMTRLHLSWTKKTAVRKVICEVNDQYWHVDLWDGTDKMFEREMEVFFASIESGAAPPNTPDEAMETLRWCIEAKLWKES